MTLQSQLRQIYDIIFTVLEPNCWKIEKSKHFSNEKSVTSVTRIETFFYNYQMSTIYEYSTNHILVPPTLGPSVFSTGHSLDCWWKSTFHEPRYVATEFTDARRVVPPNYWINYSVKFSTQNLHDIHDIKMNLPTNREIVTLLHAVVF